MNTSVVPPESRFRTYVVTGSGSIYRLGEKLEPADKSKMKRSLTDDGAVERSGSARGAAQAAREKMTAAAAAAAALSEETKRRKEREAAAAAAAAEAAEEELRQPTRESPRDRKRPMPGSSGAATADGTEEPRKKHANQYTKAAALAAAAAAAGKGVSSPRPSGKDASGGDRPRHANQHTKAAEQRAAAAAAAAERTASAGGSSSTGKHPNQYIQAECRRLELGQGHRWGRHAVGQAETRQPIHGAAGRAEHLEASQPVHVPAAGRAATPQAAQPVHEGGRGRRRRRRRRRG